MYFLTLVRFRNKRQFAFRFDDVFTKQLSELLFTHQFFHLRYADKRIFIYLRKRITVITAYFRNLILISILTL